MSYKIYHGRAGEVKNEITINITQFCGIFKEERMVLKVGGGNSYASCKMKFLIT